jgi:hypothetical protein
MLTALLVGLHTNLNPILHFKLENNTCFNDTELEKMKWAF